jgi:acetyl-CoA C-acetyltransferase
MTTRANRRRRAQAAVASGAFTSEITPVTVKTRKGETVVDKDETPGTIDIAKIPGLKPAFAKDGTVTAASSASISDGAAAVVLTRESLARERGLTPLARILKYTSFAREPEWFTLAPVGAIQKVAEAARLATFGRRSVRDQRGVRGGHHDGDEGTEA